MPKAPLLKLFSRAMAALALLIAPLAAQAQETVDADPALWVVKDKDTTIYLFGTIHVLKPELRWFDEAVKDAFDKSDEVVTEIVLSDMTALQNAVMKLALSEGVPPLTERLPEDKRAAFAAAVAAMGMPPGGFDRFDAWFASSQISIAALMKAGYNPGSGADRVISAEAEKAKKKLVGLETVEQQLGYFDSLPADAQIAMLTEMLDDMDATHKLVEAMIADWAEGDAKGLAALLNKGFEKSPALKQTLLVHRNQLWADWIDKRMDQPGTVFIAVGAAHLSGKQSVQDFLKQHKLKAKRVKY